MRGHGATVSSVACMLLVAGFWFWNAAAFVAEDSFFYAVAARRLALEGFQSFSGVFPTNGVHPLHFYLIAAWSAVIGAFSPALLWNPAHYVPLAVGLTAVGVVATLRTERLLGLASGLLTLPPLVFVGCFGVLYSEAHVLFAALAVWLMLAARGDWLGDGRRAVLTGLVHAAVFLARLDTVFLVAASAAWIAWRERARWRNGIIAAVAFLLPVAPYLAANVHFFGGLLPVSGWLKSTFPVPTVDPLLLSGSPLRWSIGKYNLVFGVMPVFVGFLLLLSGTIPRRARAIGVPLLAGAAGHMAYTSLFATWCAWYWYYVLPLVAGSFLVAAALGSMRRGAFLSAGALIAFPLVAVSLLVIGKSVDRRMPVTFRMHAAVERHVPPGSTILVSELPGYLAFRTTHRVIAADLLTGNRILYEDLVSAPNALERLFEKARERGFPIDYVVWLGGDFLKRVPDSSQVRFMDPKVISAYRVIGEMILAAPVHDEGDVAIWRIEP